MNGFFITFVILYFSVLTPPVIAAEITIYRGDRTSNSLFYQDPNAPNGRGLLLSPYANRLVQRLITDENFRFRAFRTGISLARLSYMTARQISLSISHALQPRWETENRWHNIASISTLNGGEDFYRMVTTNSYEGLVGDHVGGHTQMVTPFLSFSLNPQIAGGYATDGRTGNPEVFEAHVLSSDLTVGRDMRIFGDRHFPSPIGINSDGVGTSLLIPETEVLITGGVYIHRRYTNLVSPIFYNISPVQISEARELPHDLQLGYYINREIDLFHDELGIIDIDHAEMLTELSDFLYSTAAQVGLELLRQQSTGYETMTDLLNDRGLRHRIFFDP